MPTLPLSFLGLKRLTYLRKMHVNEMVPTFELLTPGAVRLAVVILLAECGRRRRRRAGFHLLRVAESCPAIRLLLVRRRVLGLVLHHFGFFFLFVKVKPNF